MQRDDTHGTGFPAPPGLLRRLASIAYDSLLVGGLLFLAMALVVAAMGALSGWENIDTAGLRGNPFYLLYLFVVPLLFFVWFWRAGGQTLGMRTWRFRLVSSDGTRPTTRMCVVRYFAAILSWAIFGLGFIWVWVDEEHLAWHDHLSGTRLVMVPRVRSKPQSKDSMLPADKPQPRDQQ